MSEVIVITSGKETAQALVQCGLGVRVQLFQLFYYLLGFQFDHFRHALQAFRLLSQLVEIDYLRIELDIFLRRLQSLAVVWATRIELYDVVVAIKSRLELAFRSYSSRQRRDALQGVVHCLPQITRDYHFERVEQRTGFKAAKYLGLVVKIEVLMGIFPYLQYSLLLL